jgi:hypothetical protein
MALLVPRSGSGACAWTEKENIMKCFKFLGIAWALAVFAAAWGGGSASATTIEVGGVAQNKSVNGNASLAPETSLILKDSSGTTTDTCTESQLKGATEGTFTGASVGGKVSTITVGSCSHTTKVLATGSVSVVWTSATNGTVSSSGAEITTVSTAFGVSAICKTGSGTSMGTVTGVKSGHATMDINAKVSCGILGTSTLTGTYNGTGSGGLGVTS